MEERNQLVERPEVRNHHEKASSSPCLSHFVREQMLVKTLFTILRLYLRLGQGCNFFHGCAGFRGVPWWLAARQLSLSIKPYIQLVPAFPVPNASPHCAYNHVFSDNRAYLIITYTSFFISGDNEDIWLLDGEKMKNAFTPTNSGPCRSYSSSICSSTLSPKSILKGNHAKPTMKHHFIFTAYSSVNEYVLLPSAFLCSIGLEIS